MGTARLRKTLGVVLIGAAMFASVASGEENTATKVDENGESSGGGGESGGAPQSFVVGDLVELGDWQVKVHGVTDPVPPGDFFTPDEGNRWVAVDVEVTNNSAEPATVSSIACFEMQDAENKSYNMTIGADQAASPPDGEVDAGGSRRGTITYEVPTAATGLTLRFKCDLFSSGSATINLGGAPAVESTTTTAAATP